MKAVILAGGKGTRLGNLCKEIPKPMVEIGGIPVLEHQVKLLKKYNINNIIIITGYLSEIIEDYFKDGTDFGVNINYYRETLPLGTTGGIKEIEYMLEEDFVVFFGDIMLDINLNKMMDFHQQKNGIATLALHPNDHPYDSDLVEIDNNDLITAFHSKPHKDNKYYKNLVNAGVYIFKPEICNYIIRNVSADFGKNIFPNLYKKEKMYGYNTAEYLKDAGTPERLEKINKEYLSGKISRLNNENKRPAIFIDRDGTLVKYVDQLHKSEDLELLPNSALAVKIINQTDYLAIVITNQSVIARNLCSLETLNEIHNKMDTLLSKHGAKIDALYYCPHHPDKGYPEERIEYKIVCNCRKPKIGMIKQAENNFNIDLTKSYFIGDSEIDILCGKIAGLKTIFINKNRNYDDFNIKSDYVVNDLYDAVELIMEL